MPQHILGSHPFGRTVVVSTPGSMDMVIARKPAPLGRMNPASQFEIQSLAHPLGRDLERVCVDLVFRPPLHNGGILTRRQCHRFPIRSVNLFMKEEIWSQSASGIGINATE